MLKILYKFLILNFLIIFQLMCSENTIKNMLSLHYHCSKGFTSIANLLIKSGHNVDTKNKKGDTPLHKAISFDNIPAITLLLKNKADTNIQNNDGDTPLHKAIASNNISAIGLLLKNKANTNIQNNHGETPLFKAKNELIVKRLLSNKAKLNLLNKHEQTPLHKNNAFEVFINKLSLNKQDKFKNTPLHYALLDNDLWKTKALIKHNANLDIKNKQNNSPLNISEETVEKLNSNLFYKLEQWLFKSYDIEKLIVLANKLDQYFENKIDKNQINYIDIKTAKLFILRALERNNLAKLKDIIKENNFLYKLKLVKSKDKTLDFINYLIENNIGQDKLFNLDKDKNLEINRVENIFNTPKFKKLLKYYIYYQISNSGKRIDLVKTIPNYLEQYLKNLYKTKILPILAFNNYFNNLDNKLIKLRFINTNNIISEKPIKLIIQENKAKPADLSLEILNNIFSYI